MHTPHPLRQKEGQLFGETMAGRDIFFPLKRAYGSTVVDMNDKEYIDFTSGWNVTNVGWNNSEVEEAIIEQMKRYSYAPMWTPTEPGVALAEKLTEITPESLDAVFKCTGGTEATDVALKIARAYTGKKKIISFYGEYHGQSFGAISMGNSTATTEAFEPLLPGFLRLHYPFSRGNPYDSDPEIASQIALSVLEETVKMEGGVAAIFVEPMLSCPGMFTPPAGFMEGLRAICDRYEMLLIIDEVGTGFGRTGKMFGFEHFPKATPDVVTMAKGLSGGFAPIGAVMTSRKIANAMKGKGGTSTFGWHPLATTASLKVVEIIEREKLAERAEKLGKYVLKRLREELVTVECVGEIRGWGLELGIEIVKDRKKFEQDPEKARDVMIEAMEKGLHIMWSGRTSTMMIMPPLVITQDELDRGLDILINVIKN